MTRCLVVILTAVLAVCVGSAVASNYPHIPAGYVHSDHTGKDCTAKHAWWRGTTGSDTIGGDGKHIKIKQFQAEYDDGHGPTMEFQYIPVKRTKLCKVVMRMLGGEDNHLVKTVYPKMKWDDEAEAYTYRFRTGDGRYTGAVSYAIVRKK